MSDENKEINWDKKYKDLEEGYYSVLRDWANKSNEYDKLEKKYKKLCELYDYKSTAIKNLNIMRKVKNSYYVLKDNIDEKYNLGIDIQKLLIDLCSDIDKDYKEYIAKLKNPNTLPEMLWRDDKALQVRIIVINNKLSRVNQIVEIMNLITTDKMQYVELHDWTKNLWSNPISRKMVKKMPKQK